MTSTADGFALLRPLVGTWEGDGRGNYPTIDAFRYAETLVFEAAPTYPMLLYRQSTWLLPSREPSHWEAGCIRPLPDGTVEISNAQDSGRVEVLSARFADPDPDELRLDFACVELAHDPRLVRTRRLFVLRGDALNYTVFMATRTTPEPVVQQHLRASLRRAAG